MGANPTWGKISGGAEGSGVPTTTPTQGRRRRPWVPLGPPGVPPQPWVPRVRHPVEATKGRLESLVAERISPEKINWVGGMRVAYKDIFLQIHMLSLSERNTQNKLKDTKMHQNTPKVHQNTPNYTKMQQNATKYIKIHKNLSKSIKKGT